LALWVSSTACRKFNDRPLAPLVHPAFFPQLFLFCLDKSFLLCYLIRTKDLWTAPGAFESRFFKPEFEGELEEVEKKRGIFKNIKKFIGV
jgi:hypothetical protein